MEKGINDSSHEVSETLTFVSGTVAEGTHNSVSESVRESVRAALDSIVLSGDGQTVINDIRTSPYTLSEMMYFISQAHGRWPDCEIFMDGDEYAIVARRRD